MFLPNAERLESKFFSVLTLQQEPGIPRLVAPGVYTLSFSPDGRLLFGVSNFPTPTLDIFDFAERKLVQCFSAPQGFAVLGTWIGDETRKAKPPESIIEVRARLSFSFFGCTNHGLFRPRFEFGGSLRR